MPRNPSQTRTRPKSLMFDTEDLTPTEKYVRGQRLDMGFDPDNPGTRLASGINLADNVANTRTMNRMMEGWAAPAGGGRLQTQAEYGKAGALLTGSGTREDDPANVINWDMSSLSTLRPKLATGHEAVMRRKEVAAKKAHAAKTMALVEEQQAAAEKTLAAQQMAVFQERRHKRVKPSGGTIEGRGRKLTLNSAGQATEQLTPTDLGNAWDGEPQPAMPGVRQIMPLEGTGGNALTPQVPARAEILPGRGRGGLLDLLDTRLARPGRRT